MTTNKENEIMSEEDIKEKGVQKHLSLVDEKQKSVVKTMEEAT